VVVWGIKVGETEIDDLDVAGFRDEDVLNLEIFSNTDEISLCSETETEN
jgi:hypothetical protein